MDGFEMEDEVEEEEDSFPPFFLKFINYVNEVCQDAKQTMSIACAVSKMDIPSWVVAIRHQATHGQMPTMNLMKEAIAFCRRWLWRKHWSLPFNEAIKENLSREAVEQHREVQKSVFGNKMVNAMAHFREWRKRYRSLDHFHSNEGLPLQKVRTEIEELLEQCPDEFIVFFAKSCLARQFSPSPIGLLNDYMPSSLFCVDECGNEADDDAVEQEVSLLQSDVMSHQKCIAVITGLEQNYYRPIFVLINNKGCLQRLLVKLSHLVCQDDMEFGESRRLAGWADLLLHSYLEAAHTVSTQNWRLILKHAVLSPQFFSDQHINNLLVVLEDLPDRSRQRLVHLLKIRQSVQCPTVSTSSSAQSMLDMSTYSVKSLSDLQERIRSEELADSTFVRDPLTLEDAWSVAQPEELGPLGLTADQRPDTLCLVLGECGDAMLVA
uniref:LAS1-like protein n=1 Tax=Globodera rostochiensis TaxID=31243 RepID=A0A914HSH0_GLORO